MTYDVVIIGGFGHVGLPLGMALAQRGARVCALDINEATRDLIESGQMPFLEADSEGVLEQVLREGSLELSLDPRVISDADTIIVVIGTPVDEHLNPSYEAMRSVINSYLPHFRDGQLVMLRSTVYPGTTERLHDWFAQRDLRIEVAYCPERIAEGVALRELTSLPQIISAMSEEGVERCRRLFNLLTPETLVVSPIEAELAKLFTNVYRYLKFSIANQFFMIADQRGADFHRIHHAMSYKYPRASDLPGPGFAAGPCLFKDTMQLAAFNNNTFFLGHAAMLINEGLPNYVVNKLKQSRDLCSLTVGILGMTFKANSDDPRESLSFKLRKILSFEAGRVLCTDVYLRGEELVDPDYLIDQSDVIVVATPHREYASLTIPDSKVVVDIWNLYGKGCLI